MTTITCENYNTKNYYRNCPGDGGETAGSNVTTRRKDGNVTISCNDGGETAGGNVTSR
jgi:hypothetical protein